MIGFLNHMRSHDQQLVEKFWITCHLCDLSYPNKISLHNHISRSHPSENQGLKSRIQLDPDSTVTKKSIKNEGQSPIVTKCHLCDLAYCSRWDMFAHMRKKHPVFVKTVWKACYQCSKLFPTQSAIQSHGSKVHGWKTKIIDLKKYKHQCQLNNAIKYISVLLVCIDTCGIIINI